MALLRDTAQVVKNNICFCALLCLSVSVFGLSKVQTISYQDSLKQLVSTQNKSTSKAENLLLLSKSYFGVNFKLCEQYAIQAARLSTEIKDDKNKAKAYLLAAETTLYIGNLTEGLDYLLKAENVYLKLNDSLGLAQVIKIRGIIQMNSADYGPALVSFEKAADLFVDVKNKPGEALCLMDIGIIYYYLGDYDKAAEYYFKSLNIAQEIGNQKSIAYAENNIANLYYLQKKHSESIELFEKCLATGKTLKDNILIADCEYYLALNYMETNALDKSLSYCQNALSIDSAQGNYRGIATKNLLLGDIYIKQKQFTKAKEKVVVAHHYANKTDDSIQVLANCMMKLGEINLLLNQKKEAKANLLKAINLSQKGKLRQILFEAYKRLSEVYEGENDLKNSLKYHKLYVLHKDSAINEKNNKSINQLAAIYKDEQKKSEIARLNTLSELQEKNIALEKFKSSKKSQQNLFLLIGLLGVILILGILFKSYKNKQKSNQILHHQKEAITKKNEEKELLLKEIHHRVKNNLQVISSLLSLQSNKVTDINALTELKEGQNRVKTIAMIHQKLYQHQDISKVVFQEYCEELLSYLRTTFQLPNKLIDIKVDANNVLLDIDTAVPLGLIINELVSNCFKYAFINQDEGEIRVQLCYMDKAEQKIKLTVSDNGAGLMDNFDLIKVDSLGLKLVRMLSLQLDGFVDYKNVNGAHFTILVSNTELRKLNE